MLKCSKINLKFFLNPNTLYHNFIYWLPEGNYLLPERCIIVPIGVLDSLMCCYITFLLSGFWIQEAPLLETDVIFAMVFGSSSRLFSTRTASWQVIGRPASLFLTIYRRSSDFTQAKLLLELIAENLSKTCIDSRIQPRCLKGMRSNSTLPYTNVTLLTSAALSPGDITENALEKPRAADGFSFSKPYYTTLHRFA